MNVSLVPVENDDNSENQSNNVIVKKDSGMEVDAADNREQQKKTVKTDGKEPTIDALKLQQSSDDDNEEDDELWLPPNLPLNDCEPPKSENVAQHQQPSSQVSNTAVNVKPEFEIMEVAELKTGTTAKEEGELDASSVEIPQKVQTSMLKWRRLVKRLNNTTSACNSQQSSENRIDVLQRRQKQIDYGKDTRGYGNYQKLVPKGERKVDDPKTPDKNVYYSRRAWDGLIKQWRIRLHQYDPLDE